jgi:hypothetical protein
MRLSMAAMMLIDCVLTTGLLPLAIYDNLEHSQFANQFLLYLVCVHCSAFV